MNPTKPKPKPTEHKTLVRNKRAFHDYSVLQTWEAGIVLFGSEVKSIRGGKAQLVDAYAIAKDGELFISHMKIQEYAWANQFNHPQERPRKLLLHKREILKLIQAIQQEGLTLIPLEMYLKEGKIKVLLGLCKGKRQYDKRMAEKEKDVKRELAKIR